MGEREEEETTHTKKTETMPLFIIDENVYKYSALRMGEHNSPFPKIGLCLVTFLSKTTVWSKKFYCGESSQILP